MKISTSFNLMKSMETSKEKFEGWVSEAVDTLPDRFKERLHNVVFLVEDYPSWQQKQKSKEQGLLLGLYEGYHQAKRLDVGLVLPDRITIFRQNILAISPSAEKARKKVISTVWHEIAHHFGSDEGGARKAEKGKFSK